MWRLEREVGCIDKMNPAEKLFRRLRLLVRLAAIQPRYIVFMYSTLREAYNNWQRNEQLKVLPRGLL